MSSLCGYTSYASQAYVYIQWIPFIVPLVISMAAWTFTPTGVDGKMKPVKQIILILFGLWLIVMEWFLYILQYVFQVQRYDPYCVDVLTYAFPSRISFYLATLITYLFMFAYLWNAEIHWIYWTSVFLFFVGPQSMLLWMLYNTWQEELLSTVFGVITTSMFMLFYRFYVADIVPYLVHQRPWTWFSAADTWIINEEQQRESQRIQRILNRLD